MEPWGVSDFNRPFRARACRGSHIDGTRGRVHQTLRVTPGMEAGVASHVWSVEEIVGLMG